ncbi:hypothetical protein IKF02_02005 [Candidatus Saccharibacteria bacterium]|nr:hypothetical protein [Candidatus Saccharibacteria bacterium]
MMENLTEDDLKNEEYRKQERIKEEREKAARAIEEENKKQVRLNSAYLDFSGMPKIKGFSRGQEAMRQSCERLANFSSVVVTAGVIIDFLGRMTDVSGLGTSGATMIGIIGGVGTAMIPVALFVAIFTVGAVIWTNRKYQIRAKDALRSAIVALAVGGGYEIIWLVIGLSGRM